MEGTRSRSQSADGSQHAPEGTRYPFRRAMRLVKGGQFARCYSRGARARGTGLTVVALANGSQVTRLGLSVGKKVWKSAVRRNRVRRIFREAFRLAYPELPCGWDVVMIATTKGLDPKLEPTRRELLQLVHKAARRAEERPR